MTILLTGASGFVGRHVLELLLNEGHTVIAFGRSAVTTDASRGCLKVVIGDLVTEAGFDNIAWSDIDAVVHLAASGVKASHRIWADALVVNVVGTQRLLTAITRYAERNPKVFIARTFYEHLIPQAPALLENPYIATKQAASELARIWAADYPGTMIMGTFFQVYGPGDDAGNVLSYAARELKAGRSATFGSGRGLRDWIYIKDAATAVVAALKMESSGLHHVDIGTGKSVSIREMIECLVSVSGVTNSKVEFDSARDRPDVDLTLVAQKTVPMWHSLIKREQGLSELYNKI